jgi:hypothetical protein
MRDFDIVVLSKFPEIFAGFRDSVDADAPDATKICVWDNHMDHVIGIRYQKWSNFVTVGEFNIARNANLGWKSSDKDIAYIGDDVRFLESNTLAKLQESAYSDESIGILSPTVVGLCAKEEIGTSIGRIALLNFVGFVCVYIKREVINSVGFLDENYEHYGVEDCDFCVRARKAGFKIGMTKDIKVSHGVGGRIYASTFSRTRGEHQMGRDDQENWKRFAEKWGIENNVNVIMEFIRQA